MPVSHAEGLARILPAHRYCRGRNDRPAIRGRLHRRRAHDTRANTRAPHLYESCDLPFFEHPLRESRRTSAVSHSPNAQLAHWANRSRRRCLVHDDLCPSDANAGVDWFDHLGYGLTPIVSYVAAIVAAWALFRNLTIGADILAATLVILLFTNIRNVWDLALTMARRRIDPDSER
jgi:hypothetical protein